MVELLHALRVNHVVIVQVKSTLVLPQHLSLESFWVQQDILAMVLLNLLRVMDRLPVTLIHKLQDYLHVPGVVGFWEVL